MRGLANVMAAIGRSERVPRGVVEW